MRLRLDPLEPPAHLAARASSRKCSASSGMSSGRSRSGRDADRDDVQAVVEVLAERALLDHLLEVAVRGGDDADVRRGSGFVPAHARERPAPAGRAAA